MLDALYKAAKSTGDIKVAVVPFTTDVNIGTGNVAASWLDWSDWDDENGHDQTTITCTNKKGKKSKCKTSINWVPDNHNTWNGCVMDRDQQNDALDTTPAFGDPSTLDSFRPLQSDSPR